MTRVSFEPKGMFFEPKDPIYEYREPLIFKHFYIPEQLRAELIDNYNDENIRRRRKWRHVLEHSAEKLVRNTVSGALSHHGTIYEVVWGPPGSGKSTLATTHQIIYYENFSAMYDGRVCCDRTRTYTDVNETIAWAQKNKKFIIILKDENDRTMGPDEQIEKISFLNDVDGGRKRGTTVISCGLDPDDRMKYAMNLGLRVLGFNEEESCPFCGTVNRFKVDDTEKYCDTCSRLFIRQHYINLALVYNGKRPKGLYMAEKRMDHDYVYRKYAAWANAAQDDVAARGGSIASASPEKYARFTKAILEKAIEKWPNANTLLRGHYLTVGQFERAVIESKTPLQTGAPRAAVRSAVMEAFDGYVRDREPIEEPTNLDADSEQKASAKKGSHRYDNQNIKGGIGEQFFNDYIAPSFFDSDLFLWVSKGRKDSSLPDFLGLRKGRFTSVDVKVRMVRGGDAIYREKLKACIEMTKMMKFSSGQGEYQEGAGVIQNGISGAGEPQAFAYVLDFKRKSGWIAEIAVFGKDADHQKIRIHLGDAFPLVEPAPPENPIIPGTEFNAREASVPQD